MNGSTFACRATSDLEEAIRVLEALFAVARRDIQGNRLATRTPYAPVG